LHFSVRFTFEFEQGSKGAPGLPGINGTSEKGDVGPPIERLVISRDGCTNQRLGEVRYHPGRKSLCYCNGSQWLCVRHKSVAGVVCLDFFGDQIKEGEEYFFINTSVRLLSSEACVITLVDVALRFEASQWLPRVIENLDSYLRQNLVGFRYPNQYALVQFGLPNGQSRIMRPNGNNIWFLEPQFSSALSAGVVTVGSVSDGYDSLQLVLDTLNIPSSCIPLVILVTGRYRRRAASSRSFDYMSVLQSLQARKIPLTVITATGFITTVPGGRTTRSVFGLDGTGTSYSLVADDFVGTSEGAVAVRGERTACEIFNDYGVLALNTNGSVWDKDVIRSSTVAIQTMCRIISKRIVINERLCQQCVCVDNGLGEPATPCISDSNNSEYCECRSLIGGTVESCRIYLQPKADTFQLDTSSVAPTDCSSLP
jgi:hypothetical protein